MSLAFADPVPAVEKQGSSHSFVVVKDISGKLIAIGDEVDVAR
jgi:hypothetical protein